jgi:hypothetical protein
MPSPAPVAEDPVEPIAVEEEPAAGDSSRLHASVGVVAHPAVPPPPPSPASPALETLGRELPLHSAPLAPPPPLETLGMALPSRPRRLSDLPPAPPARRPSPLPAAAAAAPAGGYSADGEEEGEGEEEDDEGEDGVPVDFDAFAAGFHADVGCVVTHNIPLPRAPPPFRRRRWRSPRLQTMGTTRSPPRR